MMYFFSSLIYIWPSQISHKVMTSPSTCYNIFSFIIFIIYFFYCTQIKFFIVFLVWCRNIVFNTHVMQYYTCMGYLTTKFWFVMKHPVFKQASKSCFKQSITPFYCRSSCFLHNIIMIFRCIRLYIIKWSYQPGSQWVP